jgi:hypothetical protein
MAMEIAGHVLGMGYAHAESETAGAARVEQDLIRIGTSRQRLQQRTDFDQEGAVGGALGFEDTLTA